MTTWVYSGPAIVLTPARPLSRHIGTSYCSIVLLLDTQPRTLHIYSGSLVHSFLSLSTSSTHCSVAPCTVVADSLTAILYLILSTFSCVPVCDLGGCLVTPDTNPDTLTNSPAPILPHHRSLFFRQSAAHTTSRRLPSSRDIPYPRPSQPHRPAPL